MSGVVIFYFLMYSELKVCALRSLYLPSWWGLYNWVNFYCLKIVLSYLHGGSKLLTDGGEKTEGLYR